MKSKYLFIVDSGTVNETTKFYHVMVGSSMVDTSLLFRLNAFAKRNGYYLRRYDSQVRDFLGRIADSLSLSVFELPLQQINIAELWSYITKFNATPALKRPVFSTTFRKQIIEPQAHFRRQLSVILKAEAERRNKPKADMVSL